MGAVKRWRGRDLERYLARPTEGVLVVEVGADWCGPCRQMEPVLARLAVRHRERVRIVRLDVDRDRETARRFRVLAVPTLLFFREGVLVGRKTGAVSEAWLERKLQQVWSMTEEQVRAKKEGAAMTKNVGGIDRWLRIALGIVLIVAGFFFVKGTAGTILGIVGFIPLITGAIGWCPLYLPFRFSTRK